MNGKSAACELEEPVTSNELVDALTGAEVREARIWGYTTRATAAPEVSTHAGQPLPVG